MSHSKKLGLIVGGALFLIGAIFAFTYSPDTTPEPLPPPIRPAKTAVVHAGGQLVERSFTGVVEAFDQVDLSFRVSGPLIELPVKAADEVKAGDVVAQIDPRDFRTNLAGIKSTLASARAQLEKMKAGEREEVIAMLENAVSAAELEYENAVIEEQRYKKLYEGGTESKSSYDKAKLAMDVAQEAVAAAKQDLARGKKGARQEDLDAQEARIRGLEQQEKHAQDALDDTVLKAPFDGRIAKRYVENFQDVKAKSPIVSVQNISRVKVVADIPENVMALLKREYVEKMTVTFDVPGKPELDVELEEVDVEADRSSQTYAVAVSLPAPTDFNVLPGMNSSLRLYLNEKFKDGGGGIPIPADALFVDPAGVSFVWVVDETTDTVSPVKVTMGQLSGDNVFVQSGLNGGERIVTAGVNFLQDGMKIRPIKRAE